MSFTKMAKNVLNISALPDKVQNQAQELKAKFDQAGVDIKEALNKLIDELESKDSASNLGAVKDGVVITLQAYLDALNDGKQDLVEGKGLSTEDFTTILKERLESMEDGANNYILPQATNETLGGIILGTTLAWINGKVESLSAPAPDEFAREAIIEHANDTEVHVTKEEKQGWDGKANSTHSHKVSDISDLTATATELNYMDGVTSNVQTQLNGKASSSHNQSASTIGEGTLAGKVLANASAKATLGDLQVRNIKASTTDLTAGSSSLATGDIYLVYE